MSSSRPPVAGRAGSLQDSLSAGVGCDAVRRILEIAVLDALGLENSVARTRVLIAAAMAATRLLEADVLTSFDVDEES